MVRDRLRSCERALKLVRAQDAERVKDEFWTLRGLYHPCLAAVHDFGRAEGAAFYTADFVDGPTLGSCGAWERPLLDALEALAFLHDLGIRHGDFKADNVRVANGRGVLLDLSCARPLRTASPAAGTPGYMAPEIMREDIADERADLYAVGATLRALGRDDALVSRLLAEAPADRPIDARELIELLGGSPAMRAPIGRAPRLLGRAREMALLEEALVTPRALVITGPPGIGRTRLAMEMKWRAQLAMPVFEGTSVRGLLETASGAPIESLDDALRAAASLEACALLLDDADGDPFLPAVRASERALWIVTTREPLDGTEIQLGPLDDAAIDEWTRGVLDERAAAEVRIGSGGVPAAIEAMIARGTRALALPYDPVELRALAALAVGTIDEPSPALLSLQRSGWARRIGDRFSLACPSDREPLLRALDPALVRELHLERAQKTAGPERAEHLARAGEHAEAALLIDRADAPSYRAAAEVLASAPSAEIRLIAAEILELAGSPDRALSILARVLRSRPPREVRARLHLAAGRTFLKLGRAKRALQELSKAGDDPAVADLASRAHRQLGQYQRAYDEAARARTDDPALRTLLEEDLGIAATFLGRSEEARAHLEGALSSADPRARVRVQSYLAILETREGHPKDAIERHRAALAIAEEHGLHDQIASASTNLGTALEQHGEYGPALDAYERALRLASALEKSRSVVSLRFNLANLCATIGARERAERELAACKAAAIPLGLAFVEGSAALVEGELATDAPTARASFERAREIFEREGLARERLEAELAIAEAELAMGDVDAARAALERAPSADGTDLVARALALRAKLAPEREVISLLERALSIARDRGQRPLEASIELELARAFATRGAPALAAEHRARAVAAIERIGASLPPSLRDAFFAHPSRRDLRAPRSVHAAPDLRRFLEVNKRLNSQLSVDAVLEHAMDAAIELTFAERGFVLLASSGGQLEVRVARNLDRERIGRSHSKFSRSIAEQVIETDEPLVTTDASSDERFRSNVSVHAMRLRSVVCVPIRSPEGTLGALYLDNRFRDASFDRSSVELLTVFADQVAIAIRNARLVSELSARTRELEREKARVEELLRGREREIVKLHEEVRSRQRALEYRYDYRSIVGRGPAMRAVLDALERIIEAPISVLIQGESGTGKELVARAIHFNGPRREGPFVSINCAALPETLLESELFGHVRGAFTGADRDREGLFVAARGGTLFLDELAETTPAFQAKLLRALQEREVRPVGASGAIAVDVRVLAATNRKLSDEVAAGRFRADLYYRVGVVEVTLPPLRERTEDIPELARAIVARLASESGKPPPELAPDLVSALVRHPWPGNVRELENALTRAYFMSGGAPTAADLTPARASTATSRSAFEADEARRILAALEANRWNVRAVCRQLGIPSNTLYRKLKRYKIERV